METISLIHPPRSHDDPTGFGDNAAIGAISHARMVASTPPVNSFELPDGHAIDNYRALWVVW